MTFREYHGRLRTVKQSMWDVPFASLMVAGSWARGYDGAITHVKKTLKMDPKFGVALFWLEGSLRHKGMCKEAVALRQAITTLENAQRVAQKYQPQGFPALLRDSAVSFKTNPTVVEAARRFEQIGERDRALSLLENCYQHRCYSLVTLKAEPDFDVLRSEPRYQDLERHLGLGNAED